MRCGPSKKKNAVVYCTVEEHMEWCDRANALELPLSDFIRRSVNFAVREKARVL